MAFAVHGTGAELTLCGTEGIGAVFIEYCTDERTLSYWFIALAPTKYDAQKEKYKFGIMHYKLCIIDIINYDL
jgi:hypothetical protein